MDMAIIDPGKLQNYLLSSSHPVGRFKAEFFKSIGFTDENRASLEIEIRALLRNEATIKEETEYGQKYEVRGIITGPAGLKAEIVTVWIVLRDEETARFITAYPGD